MDSTVKPEQTGAHDVLLVRGDDKPTSDYEKVVREELARVQERLAKLASERAPEPPKADIAPAALDPKITTFRPTVVDDLHGAGERHALRKAAMSGVTALLLAMGAAGAAIAWQSPYADAPKAMIEHWAPQLASILSLPLNRAAPAAEPTAPAVQQTAAADTAAPQAPAQPAPAQAESPPQDAAPAVAAPSAPDVAQLLQSMARDLANLEQGMEQLKASQDQLARDNAKLAEQLKATQEQMTRVIARASEPNLRPSRPPAPKPVAPPPLRRPVATLPPPQTIAPAQAAAAPLPQPAPAPQMQAEEPDMLAAPRPPKAVP
ncbi:hypothetical protein [Bradyrhizobium sp. ARR65]|uniref:hypothetical protein n=1 Tax=Bradyrhizobium sp. ARR65 TaxID=1040989 RepID=UPI00046706D6|nr:hypothetical protein [Bradyrhizobium sp. ARR65]